MWNPCKPEVSLRNIALVHHQRNYIVGSIVSNYKCVSLVIGLYTPPTARIGTILIYLYCVYTGASFRILPGGGAVASNITRKDFSAEGAKKIWQFPKKITPIVLISSDFMH